MAKLSWRSFEEARVFVQSLALKSQAGWFAFCKGNLPEKGALPADIPVAASRVYADKGWVNWGDWLGTGTIAPRLRAYRPFKEARAFARGLDLKSSSEWSQFCKGKLPEKGKLPPDIPANPNDTYADTGWAGIGDWLGTGNVAPRLRHYRPFGEARAFARSLGLKSRDEWVDFCKGNLPEKGTLPSDIPATPNQTYAKKGWVGIGDWLGTGRIADRLRQYRPFIKARIFARSLGLKSGDEWAQFCKGKLPQKGTLPHNIPMTPNNTYADKGWVGMGDWLGTGTIAPRLRQYRPFEQARAFARSLGLKGSTEWWQFCKGKLPEKGALPPDIPVNARSIYAEKGWAGMGDWLGTGNIANFLRQYRPFKQARAFARSLGLKNTDEWMQFCKGNLPEKGTFPSDIPANPNQTYANKGWVGMGDWLGTGTVAARLRQYRPFKEARDFARGLGLKNNSQWRDFCNGNLPQIGTWPSDIPAKPDRAYADKGWAGFGDWLGTGVVAPRLRQYRPFEKARAFTRSLYLENRDEWNRFCQGKLPSKGRLPADIPTASDRIYASKGWSGWPDWLGTSRTRVSKSSKRKT